MPSSWTSKKKNKKITQNSCRHSKTETNRDKKGNTNKKNPKLLLGWQKKAKRKKKQHFEKGKNKNVNCIFEK